MNDLQTITASLLLLVIVAVLLSYAKNQRQKREHRVRVNESFRQYVQANGDRE